jgi:hypothetical protein
MALIREHLAALVRRSADFDPGIQVRPACILWPDGERQWETAILALQKDLPELLVLGAYDPKRKTGPAIWLRCAVAGQADDIVLPGDRTPILYLPGFSRQDLRAVESCPESLVALAELQYRGTIWSQANGKDWTVTAFLRSGDGGPGLEVAQDAETRRAAQLALYRLIDQEVSLLAGKRLDRDTFNALLTGGDTVRDLLRWMDRAEAFHAERSPEEWQAFVDVCKSKVAFDPGQAGVLEAAVRLARREGAWVSVWERFKEAPRLYPRVPALIRQCSMPDADSAATTETHGGWPQWNDSLEAALRGELATLGSFPEHEARSRLLLLEKKHGPRRSLVWAEMGEAPLALALEHLAAPAEVTTTGLGVGELADVTGAYAVSGWRADAALIGALSCVDEPSDVEAVTAAIRALYLSWAQDSAAHLQRLLYKAPYPGGAPSDAPGLPWADGECVLFVDGLRLDIGMRLEEMLRQKGCAASHSLRWAPLPSVTATAKPAVSPVRGRITGAEATADFEPVAADTGHSLKGGHVLRKLLGESGWKILGRDESGDGKGRAWTEIGNIDHEGHEQGRKLARRLDALLLEVRRRVLDLLGAGWGQVRVVTDHGWLLVPGGLPRMDLPAELVENKWGRCALLKPGADTKERLYAWYWNANTKVAVAGGIHCFRQGCEYAHGGLSFQECLTPEIVVTLNGGGGAVSAVSLHGLLWKGLRCTVTVSGSAGGIFMDIRTHAGDPASSLLQSPVSVREDGTASALVIADDREGEAAVVVLVNREGGLMAQRATVVGGGRT